MDPQPLFDEFRRQFTDGEPFLPRIIHLETRTRCSGTCSFCAASILTDTRPDILMDDQLLNKFLGELQELDYPNRLSLYNNNEPFLDKRLPSIIEKARHMLPRAYIELKSNGKGLNEAKVLDVFQRGLDILYINDYRSAKDVEEKRYSPNIETLRQALHGVRRFKGHFDGQRYFERIIIELRQEDAVLGARAGTSPNRDLIDQPLQTPCLRPFEMVTINPAGDVGLCSDDVFCEVKMGNIGEEKFIDIWSSVAYDKVRDELLNGNRSCKPTCARCDNKGYTMEVFAERNIGTGA